METKNSCSAEQNGDCSACSTEQKSGCSSRKDDSLLTQDTPDTFMEEQAMERKLAKIRHRIIVMSGKGGVGKSTVATNLAVSLSLQGKKVGLLDVDIHGPSIPGMLKLNDEKLSVRDGMMVPVEKAGLKVMSIGFMLKNRDEALIWRGPMKHSMINQFIKDVDWGELDYLIIDAPPGTGDEPLAVCQLAAPLDGAVIVTTPQQVATDDVRKSLTFCRKLDLPVLGLVENMSGFVCPCCKTVTAIFKDGGGERLAQETGVQFLGKIPIDPAVGDACDDGTPFVYHYNLSETAKAFEAVATHILEINAADDDNHKQQKRKVTAMKIAIPMAEGKLCMHFGHCEQFAILEVDDSTKAIRELTPLTPPPHEPGVLPRWLHEQGANVIIAGGMGQRAQALFAENNINVVVGAPGGTPSDLARQYIDGVLTTGQNVCDH